MRLEIPGVPVAKKRPRFFRKGNHVGTYNPQQTEEGYWLWHATQQIQGRRISGPCSVGAVFVLPIPKSTTKRNRAAMEAGDVPHTKKPDIDNLLKFVMDCLNGVLWHDDAAVVSVAARKVYGAEPKTIIEVEEIA